MLAEPSEIPLTFTSLSLEAQVSRRTLYTHWGSVDRIIADAVSVVFADENESFQALAPDERLHYFLRMTRDRMSLPLTATAFATLISRAAYNAEAAEALVEMDQRGMDAFIARVGPITKMQYDIVIGPIYYAAYVSRVPLTDEQLSVLATSFTGVLTTA
jgi:AcrR family transcriptional regulator